MTVWNDEQNDYFLIRISDRLDDISIQGNLAWQSGNTVFVSVGEHTHGLLELGKQITIKTVSGNRVQVYARVVNGQLCLSNLPHLLFKNGETLEIKTVVLAQQLLGETKPLNNYFNAIEELDASWVYQYSNGVLKKKESLLNARNPVSLDYFKDFLMQRFSRYPQAVSLLISAGYDSRLNLALCMACKKDVIMFHERTYVKETDVVLQLADTTSHPLHLYKKSDFNDGIKKLEIADVRTLNMGYRKNLIKWSAVLSHIQAKYPERKIIGMGAEAHKGMFYKKIYNLERDALLVLGVNVSKVVHGLFSSIQSENFHAQKVSEWVSESRKHFEDLSAQIDYVHYHVKVNNYCGGRNHFLTRRHKIDFPLLDNEFLSHVFSLPRERKEGGGLVTALIASLDHELLRLPVYSGNVEQLGEMSLYSGWRRKLGKLRRSIEKKSVKPVFAINLKDPQTDLTRRLHQDMHGRQHAPSAERVYRYLTFLEAEYNVDFRLV